MNKDKSQILYGLAIILIDFAYNLINQPVLIGYLDRVLIFIGLFLLLTGIFKEGIIAVFKKIHLQSKNKPHYFLLTILIASLIIRITLLPERWINPDEGAHLYDAKFALSGKIPFADYKSRMPVYVYLLAILIKLFGTGYNIGRLLPLFSNIGIGVLIFFITNKLYDRVELGLLASTIYLLSPLSILWAVVVKTELVATFFVSLGMYFVITNLKSEKEKYGLLFFSGFFFALAFYVRKSALVFAITPLILFIYFYKKNILNLVKAYGAILFGYLSVVSIVFLFFGSFMGINPVLESGLNPSNVLIDPLKKIGFSADQFSGESELPSDFRSKDQSYPATLWQWKSTIKLNIYLIIGLALSIIIFIQKTNNEIRFSYFFTYSWFFMLALFYLYYTFQRGFFTQYFGELL
ncbi:MAG: ArnT family glycosyltransferase, partial [Candidatus Hodarchaeales archaeon]